MIKLSDYLDYLQKEIIQARKKADENAIEVAKAYADHEYLKYFKVPRFSMPTIKIDIPLKISDIVSETEYEFEFNNIEFARNLNTKIEFINKDKNLNIPVVKPDDLDDNNFADLFKNFNTRNNNFTRNLNANIIRENLDGPVNNLIKINDNFRPQDDDNELVKNELKNALTDTIVEFHRPVSSKLNELFIDPDTANDGDGDKNKLMVNLHVEMVEEAIRIVKMKDKDGNDIEEITFE